MKLPGARSQWLWPTLAGGGAVVGLPAALFGEGGWLWLASWLLLAVPLILIVEALARRRKPAPSPDAGIDQARRTLRV